MTKKTKLEGKVALVTGSAQGLGEAILKEFVYEGASTILLDLNRKEANKVKREIEESNNTTEVLIVDVCDSKSVNIAIDNVIKKYKKIDILVNAVGGFHNFDKIKDITDEEWHKVININLNSAFYCTRAVMKYMEESRTGRIINISSGAGIAPNPHAPSYVPYGAAKAGLLGMTKLLARDAGEFGITVNAIAPGTALTPRVKKVRDPESIANIAKMNPLKNIIEPIDCAKAAVFLASDDARYVTGITMMVNAGNLIF
ncbi:MAG: SDR family NAD(P)-dependent oxidoreductase [Hyphomicrobiales bacterium]|jgi:3-oxoacyl-[acyl-carrier protein] reductase|nr:SDR family NAD(P)-dependent oxidoreductase [Hyphomicrobiales bacterium]|tara:strand:- start:2295 stop:3065 length:771 start_codon:yes stop_codon:yes gene_type:complete